ncbi:MAG TPA: TraB/GumN family protein [Gammaproteobacteria bacterium]|nr:TraB/GumN family protein [Gammaproteobacteria bacterium]
MHRNLAKLLLSLIVLLNVTSALAKDDKAFFWQVKSDNAVVYLMGSIHFAKSGFYPLRERIEEAFEHSDALVVELDINHIDSNTYSQLIAQRGTYKDSTTIKDVISEETWLQLRQRLRYLNVSYDTIKNYKPGILVLTLTSIQIMQMGFAPQLGIDAYFLAKASQADKQKKIIELETLEQQINLFLNIPDGELLLKESLYSLDESELLMADMVRFWKQGDEAEMNKLLFEDALTKYPAFSAIYESLFYDRNSRMVEKIDGMLQQKGRYFVVVGSGHLIGEKGIVSALKEKGYEVSRK